MSTFATLPFFLFTLPAGVFADTFDRKQLLCFMNLWLAMAAAGLAAANWIGAANPYLILGTVFLSGVGFAFDAAPAWTAIIPEVVTREDLPSAITLGGLQMNISGIVGPAIGGLILSRLGVNVCLRHQLCALSSGDPGGFALENLFAKLLESQGISCSFGQRDPSYKTCTRRSRGRGSRSRSLQPID